MTRAPTPVAARVASKRRNGVPSSRAQSGPVRVGSPVARDGERGMNMVEVMLVLLTLSILSSMIINSIRRFTSAHAFSEGQARVHEIGDRIVWQVSEDASLASHVFTAGGEAAGYLGRCQLGTLTPFCATPPTTTERGYFEADTPEERSTGNYLLLAKNRETFLADLSSDRTAITSVGVYRFVLYLPVTTLAGTLDLARWVSQDIARLADIERITDPVKRTLMGQKLYDAGFRFAWEPGRSLATGLREITSVGSLTIPGTSARIPGDQTEQRSALLHNHRMSLATNGSLPNIAVPGYAVAEGGFPGGFEVKVDGTATGRMILVRLVVSHTLFDGNRNALAFSRTMSNRGTI